MSRQSKQAKKMVLAKQATAQRKGGNRGPSQTTTSHGKVHTWSRMGRKVVTSKKNHD